MVGRRRKGTGKQGEVGGSYTATLATSVIVTLPVHEGKSSSMKGGGEELAKRTISRDLPLSSPQCIHASAVAGTETFIGLMLHLA